MIVFLNECQSLLESRSGGESNSQPLAATMGYAELNGQSVIDSHQFSPV